jgi:hypothetical protein
MDVLDVGSIPRVEQVKITVTGTNEIGIRKFVFTPFFLLESMNDPPRFSLVSGPRERKILSSGFAVVEDQQ